jgi:uncharacterized protein YgbK (DUF1537 family)
VIALKTRAIAAVAAVEQSLGAYRWLAARQPFAVMVKYCSTFDSTNQGNIGPVVDAVMEASGAFLSVVCPAFPTNKRTIYKGRLFVGDVPLDESSMRDHPLTPMRDSSLVRLMARQSPHQVGLIPWEIVTQGADAIAQALDGLASRGVRHAVTDALTDQDLVAIGQAAWPRTLLTGGSGIAIGVPEICRSAGLARTDTAHRFPAVGGPSIVLAGSCSAATNGQVASFKASGGPAFRLDPLDLAGSPGFVDEAADWVRRHLGARPILVYSTSGPELLQEAQGRLGTERAASLVEDALARVARAAVDAGAARIIVAGGETSGAVMHALGIRSLCIGPEIDPGVPWTATLGEHPLALALKSGNFGGPDFFTRAFEVLP